MHWKTEKYNLGKKLWGWNVYYNKCSAIKFIKFSTEGIDDDVTFDKRSSEYQNYLIAREHKPSTVKQLFEFRNKTGAEARTKQDKQDRVSNDKFITTYNPALPTINKIIQNNVFILNIDEEMKKLSPSMSRNLRKKFYLIS